MAGPDDATPSLMKDPDDPSGVAHGPADGQGAGPVPASQAVAVTGTFLPLGYRLAENQQQQFSSLEEMETAIRCGRPIRLDLLTDHRYGLSERGLRCHIVREVRGYLHNNEPDPAWRPFRQWQEEYGQYRYAFIGGPAAYPEPPPLASLSMDVRLSATWACGNASNHVKTMATPTTQRCPACFGLPVDPRAPRALRGPAVHALPPESGSCQARDLLAVRRCHADATWLWAHTPVCTRHLAALREHWLDPHTTTGDS